VVGAVGAGVGVAVIVVEGDVEDGFGIVGGVAVVVVVGVVADVEILYRLSYDGEMVGFDLARVEL
jgi:hypothetical protein